MSSVLFEGRNYPVVVVFSQNSRPDAQDILHVAVRRTRAAKERLFFEIDKYDQYYVPKEVATTDQLVWKADLLGSGHLYYLVERFKKLRTLEGYLKKMKKERCWVFAEGYRPLGESTKAPEKAAWLSNKRWIPTEYFTGDDIRHEDTVIETAETFDRTRKKNKLIFKGPHLLIKETPDLPVAFVAEDLIFRHEIIGIHAPDDEDKAELEQLRRNIISSKRLYRMLLLAMSGRAGVSRSTKTVLKKDIFALPYPEDRDSLKLSVAEKIVCDDILNYCIEQLERGEDAKMNVENARPRDLSAFARVFCASLNSIYKRENKEFYPLEHIEALSFICFPFAYGNPDKPKSIPLATRTQIREGDLAGILTDSQQERVVLYRRIIKEYGKNMVYLVKPRSLRYWLRSVAMRDANEMFADLVNSGY